MKRRILSLLLALVLAVGLIPAAAAGENPDTGSWVKPAERSNSDYLRFHRYVALGQEITIDLGYRIQPSYGGPRWKLYKTDINGSETEAELAEIGENLLRKGKSSVDSGGAGIYNSSVRLNVDETFDASELGVGTYLMVGYVVYQKNNKTTTDYDALCAIAIHVLKEEQPITSVKYYLCEEDGTTIRQLTQGEQLTVNMANSGNGLESSYMRIVPSPANATEYVDEMIACNADERYMAFVKYRGDNFYVFSGEHCGEGPLELRIKSYADNTEGRVVEDVFPVTVPHVQDGEPRRLIRPNCTEPGLWGAWCECHYTGCDYVFEERILPPYGHALTETSKKVVTEPTATKPGLAVGFCSGCSVRDAEVVIPAIFCDVKPDAFYSEALDHGYAVGWVTGTSANTFSPTVNCSRAQVVTFLWRAAGCPEPETTEHPFVDVKVGSFYEKAVLWAVENGITNGTDESHFSPDKSCNRAQVVTFLYRAMGNPDFTNTDCPFTDVAAGQWYEAPILWAVENGVTNGMGDGTFGVDTTCNRAQVVTFLHRTYVN